MQVELLAAVVTIAAATVLLLLAIGVVMTWRRIEGELVGRVLRRALVEAPALADLRAELAELADATHAQLAVLVATDRALREEHASTTAPLHKPQPGPAATPCGGA